MSLFAFSTTVPTTGHLPSIDYTTMAANNVSAAGIMAVDHIGFNITGGGWHNQSTYPNLGSAPTTASGQLALYSKAGAVSSELWMIRDANAGTATALTTSKIGAPTVSTNGCSWLPGGILIQWGTSSVPTSGTQVVTFPVAFPNNAYNVSVTGIRNNSGGDGVFVLTGSVGNTGFTLRNGSGSISSVYWMAIGN